MAKLTRRGFLKKTSAGALAIGALGAVPGAALAAEAAKTPAARGAETVAAEPFVVYVRNPAAGEMVLLAGTQEFTHTDPDLVARLWRATEGRHGASKRTAHSVVR